MNKATDKGAEFVTFGETLLPGYPFWLELTGGAVFNFQKQKELHTY
ncbi:MAG: nitrilase [Paraglaciecola sp.]|jgi:nitrilase